MFQLVGKWPYGYEGSYTPDDISRIGKEAGLVGIKVYGLLYYIPSNIGFTKIYPAAWSPFFKKASAFLSKLGALRFLFAYAIVMEGAKQ